MKFKALPITLLCASFSTFSIANTFDSSLTLYKQAALFGKQESKDLTGGNFYINVPSTVIDGSLVVDVLEGYVMKKEFKRNDFNRLLNENIGNTIKVGEKEGILKSISQGFLLLETKSGLEHIAISGVEGFQFEKNIPLSSGLYEVYTDIENKSAIDVAYNYLFRGLSWSTNHQIFMDEKNNVFYRSDLVVDNTTDLSFENTKLNLMAGDIQIGGSHRPQMMHREMVMADGAVSKSSGASFESFEGFQKLTYPEPVVILDNTETHLSFQNYDNMPSRKEYRFNTFYPRHNKVEDLKANMFLILEREDHKDYHFPFTSGKVSVYKGMDAEESTLLTSQSIGNYSEDDDIEISMGQSFDVDVNYTSKMTGRNVDVVVDGSDNKIQILKKTYEFKINFKNNEPSSVDVLFNFNGSTNHQGIKRLTIDAESEKEVSYRVTYIERRRLN